MILIIKHIDIEGPGLIGAFFENTDWEIETIELGSIDRSSPNGLKRSMLPRDLSQVEAIITLGGPMNVYEEEKYPFLKEEDVFFKDAIKKEIPILGICLGAQLLAKACGAKIEKAKEKEIGLYKVSLTEDGAKDPLFKGLNKELDVFQWHEDTFELPDKAKLLAISGPCRNQSFKAGKNAYGLQFHVEITSEMIEFWINRYGKDVLKGFDAEDMMIQVQSVKDALEKQANLMSLNFARIMTASRKSPC